MDGAIPVSGAVIAGGTSSRMGRDKRWIEVEGVPLLQRATEAVAEVADDVHVVVASPGDAEVVRREVPDLLETLGERCSVDVDLRPDEGPLAGIETALAVATNDIVVVVAADHPFVAPALLRLLIDRIGAEPDRLAAAIVTDRGSQPLLAAYRRAAWPHVTALLDGGERRARALLDALDPLLLEASDWRPADPSERSAQDLDTPSDLARVAHRPDRSDRSDRSYRTRAVRVIAVGQGTTRRRDDVVVGEDPLEVRACGPHQQPVTVVTTMRTRGHDDDLAVGWLWSEGLVQPGAVSRITRGDAVELAQPDDQVTVHLTHPLDLDAVVHRHAAATASCGVCGRASIDELAARAVPIPDHLPDGPPLPWSRLVTFPDLLRADQQLFATTGGIHATGLFSAAGDLVTLREDVGRHNALDAAIGAHVRAGETALHHLVGVLSGRIGFELVAKAAMAGVPILAAVGAPSDLAVRTADRLGITLVGFLRGGNGNVYTHATRLDLDA